MLWMAVAVAMVLHVRTSQQSREARIARSYRYPKACEEALSYPDMDVLGMGFEACDARYSIVRCGLARLIVAL